MTGYDISKQLSLSSQLVYRILRSLRTLEIVDTQQVPVPGKPDRIYHRHTLDDETQKAWLRDALREMNINTKHGSGELTAVSLCIGFLHPDVIRYWAHKFIEFQQSLLLTLSKQTFALPHLPEFEVRYRQHLIKEAQKLLKKRPLSK